MTPKKPVFDSLTARPDHDQLERSILDRWENDQTFERLRQQISGSEPFSFIDGPVTANKTLGVHTAWGRTLKDVFQRYKASQGYDLRFQNGFDCQGLWIEVGVERELGLNSKKDIEEFGLEEFARRCRAKVAWSVEELRRGSKRLGYWMDWDNDYLTFSDNNIDYIWRFLKTLDDKNRLYLGHRATEWCPRCGTSISQHEISGQSGVYQDRSDPSLSVRFPLSDRPGESLVIWTTTPWTLPANVAAAVHPDHMYGRRPNGEWVAVDRFTDEEFEARLEGSEMIGWAYTAPFDNLEAAKAVEHRVIPWKEVTMEQGTGIVHIAPGAGREDFELSKVHDLAVLTPVDGAGKFYPEYGWLAGLSTDQSKDEIIDWLRDHNYLVASEEYLHPYPHCWRCDTPLIFRVADDWYIAVDELRQPLLDANATVEWTPSYMGKLMEDWLRNMEDWNISRRRYYGLPLPFWPCQCGHVNVIGSRRELEVRATEGIEQLEELRRPWIDRVKITCSDCGKDGLTRIEEVGDVWLDAGIVPFATLGWNNDAWTERGNATGAAAGLTTADLPNHEYWEKWFPAQWVTEMREQVRLWFYSQLFMSVALVGKAPFRQVLGYEKMLAEDGREMHGSWGNLISAEDAFSTMGADVMRWMYCAHPPDRNLLFGYEGARDVQRKLLTLWNSAKFVVDYSNIEGFIPSYSDLSGTIAGTELTQNDRWLVSRAALLVDNAEESLNRYRTDELIAEFEAFIDDLSNWYIRRSRRRFYDFDEAAFRTLWFGVVTALRVIAPVMPFMTEHLWRILVADVCPDAPDSIHLAGWPELSQPDLELVDEMASVRRVVEAGRRARMDAGIKLRQPVRRMVVNGAALAEPHIAEIQEELRVKEIAFNEGAPVEVSYKPNFPKLGPRLGPKMQDVANAISAGDFRVEGDRLLAAGETLEADEYVRSERVVLDGWHVAYDGTVSVALDPHLDDELLLEGAALDLVRNLNDLRKQAGMQLTDRITVTLPPNYQPIIDQHGEMVAAEVLATDLSVDGQATELSIELDALGG